MGQKILVVEDNELNLKLFCDLLRAHGYEAEPVRDGREAMERAGALSPDLVVMDIQMPHISGLELIEQMKGDEALKRVPIMAVTAYAAKGDEDRIRDAGAEGYVSKPISVMKFIEAVRALLDAAAANPPEASAEADAEPAPHRHPGESRGFDEEEAESPSRDPGFPRDDEDAQEDSEPPAPDANQAETPEGEPRLPDTLDGGEEPPRLI